MPNLFVLLTLEDLDPPTAPCAGHGHPDQALTQLLDRLADPELEPPPAPCASCPGPLRWEHRWQQGQPVLQETLAEGGQQTYMLHPQIARELLGKLHQLL